MKQSRELHYKSFEAALTKYEERKKFAVLCN